MARLDVRDGHLRVELSRWESVGALSRSFAVPLSSIVSVTRVPEAGREIGGLRAPGTGVPGVVALGRWRRRGGRVDFVATRRRDPGYVVELTGERFDRLVISSRLNAGPDGLGLPDHDVTAGQSDASRKR